MCPFTYDLHVVLVTIKINRIVALCPLSYIMHFAGRFFIQKQCNKFLYTLVEKCFSKEISFLENLGDDL